MLFAVIIVLLVIIAILAFFVGRGTGGWGSHHAAVVSNGEDVVVTIIDDKRCSDCGTDQITTQMKQVPFLSLATFEEKDFSDEGTKEFLEENNISVLPAVVFSTNTLWDGGTMTPYLKALPGWEFSLEIGSSFDPFQERSDKWFLVLDPQVLETINTSSHFLWAQEASVAWVEYSDLGCHFCQKLHSEWTIEEVMKRFPNELQKTTNHYISVWGQNSRTAAEIIECVGEVAGSKEFNEIFEIAFESKKYTADFLIEEAGKLWVNTEALNNCIENPDIKTQVQDEMNIWNQVFGITGTPGNVIINVQTGEYQVIPGAFPAENFIQTIDSLLN